MSRSDSRPRDRRRSGFSLVELLVVLAVVSLLISILLPGLRGARTAARQTQCTANLRTLGAAWQMYINDFRVFPVPRSNDIARWIPPGGVPRTGAPRGLISSVHWSFGGVHWYGRDSDGDLTTPSALVDPSRPLNIYIQSNPAIENKTQAFRCPSDNGSRDTVRNTPNIWVPVAAGAATGTTMYEQLGTSYEANDWMYCLPGSNEGVLVRGFPERSNFAWWLGPQHLRVGPSRFVILGDAGAMCAGRYPQTYLLSQPTRHGWWHGTQISNFAFLDGSVRRHETGAASTPLYTFYMDESRLNQQTYRMIQRP